MVAVHGRVRVPRGREDDVARTPVRSREIGACVLLTRGGRGAIDWILFLRLRAHCARQACPPYTNPTQTTAKLADAVAERALDKNLVPPIFFNNLKKMLKEGMLQVCCVELECVGFNRALYASLLSEAGGSASSVSSREPAGGRKRDQRDGEPSYRRREEKRRRMKFEQH